MYDGGLSRKNIFDALNGDLSERQIRKISKEYGDFRNHDSAKRDARSQLKERHLSRRDYYVAQRNKMIGRGQRIGGKHEVLNKKEVNRFWKANKERAEGSP